MRSIDVLSGGIGDSVVDDPPVEDVGGLYWTQPVSTPEQILRELPRSRAVTRSVRRGRRAARRVLEGRDDRLLVVVGPCSIHDVRAGEEYATRLARVARDLSGDLLIAMRAYVEKPRTTGGWTGLLADPGLDGSMDLGRGLRCSRRLMRYAAERGLPVATEWLSPAAPSYLADLVSWGAIGARTVESQVHRQLASGLPMPVGMKNDSTGSVKVAADAIRFASTPQAYVTVGPDGVSSTVRTTGNPDCHLVLRGGPDGPNYGPADVREAELVLAGAGLPTGLVVDASHANSGKDHERQAVVAREIGDQVAGGGTDVRGVMLESFLEPGRQDAGAGELTFGRSITDACMGWDVTEDVLRDLALAVRRRRTARPGAC